MGAGVDHIINDELLPKNVPLCRISDKKLSFSMTNYIITAVMFYHRRLLKYKLDKENKIWDNKTPPEIPIKVGILGYGALGSDAASKLHFLGFNVVGYSLNKKSDDKIKVYHGDNLNEFLDSQVDDASTEDNLRSKSREYRDKSRTIEESCLFSVNVSSTMSTVSLKTRLMDRM